MKSAWWCELYFHTWLQVLTTFLWENLLTSFFFILYKKNLFPSSHTPQVIQAETIKQNVQIEIWFYMCTWIMIANIHWMVSGEISTTLQRRKIWKGFVARFIVSCVSWKFHSDFHFSSNSLRGLWQCTWWLIEMIGAIYRFPLDINYSHEAQSSKP